MFIFRSLISKKTITILLFLIPFYVILYKIYSTRVNAFGCFDDCFNFIGGYFLVKGRTLYSEIFFNHQPAMAYISGAIQYFFPSINIYELVLFHRRFILAFGFIINFLIIYRFRAAGFLFVLFYELTKFYIFGDRFLAEGLVVYLLVYMVGLVWYKMQNKKIYQADYIISAIFSWLVVFSREPFIISALFAYGLLLLGKSFSRIKIISFGIFSILTFVVLIKIPFSDYVFNVGTINSLAFGNEYKSLFSAEILKIFFYPFYLFIGGDWNVFRYFILGLDVSFIFLLIMFLRKYREIKTILILFLILGLANIRHSSPGRIFYDAFHMIPWYGIFLISIFLMLVKIYSGSKKQGIFVGLFLTIMLSYFILSPDSFIREKTDMQTEFITNYGNELQVGEVIKILSNKKDTLFLDGADDLIYWQAKLISPYKYSWYTSYMPYVPRYVKARTKMFNNNPPDFYFGSCPKKMLDNRILPENIRNQYQQLYSQGKPTCLYVFKKKLNSISKEQWKKANEFLYYLPTN